MRPGVLVRKLGRDLRTEWGSVLSLTALVATGIACLVGARALFRDLDGARERYYRASRLADLVVELRRAPEVAGEGLEADLGLLEVRTRLVIPGIALLPGEAGVAVTARAYSLPEPGRPALNDVALVTGTRPRSPFAPEVVLDHQFATARGLGVGDRITLVAGGGEHALLVVGTARSPELVWLMPAGGGLVPDPAKLAAMHLERRFLAGITGMEGAVNQLLAKLRDQGRAPVEAALARLERRLEPWGVLAAFPMEDDPSVRFLADELFGLGVTSRLFPLVFLGVACLVQHFVLVRMVERGRVTLGTLAALGYPGPRLVRHAMAPGLVVGGLGGLVGLGLGRWMQTASIPLYRTMFSLPGIEAGMHPDLGVLGMVVALVATALGGLGAARRVAAMEPAESMRPAPPESGSNLHLERIGGLWRRLPFPARVALRSVARSPFRSGVGVLATACATSLVLSQLALLDSVDGMMRHQFEAVRREDLAVSLEAPVEVGDAAGLGRLPGVLAWEPELVVPVELGLFGRRRKLAVVGLPEDAWLQGPRGADGAPVRPVPGGIVLERKLAELLGAGVGDRVTVRVLLGERREVRVPVGGVVEGFLGLSAWMAVGDLGRMAGGTRMASGALLVLEGGTAGPGLAGALAGRAGVTGFFERRRARVHLEASFGDVQRVAMGIMVFFSGLLAFGAVLNAALVTLSERAREVATYRVLGYSPGRVFAILAGELALVHGVGAGLGVAGGIRLVQVLARAYDTELYRFPAQVPGWRIPFTLAIMGVFVGAALLGLALAMRRRDPLEALGVRE